MHHSSQNQPEIGMKRWWQTTARKRVSETTGQYYDLSSFRSSKLASLDISASEGEAPFERVDLRLLVGLIERLPW